jgi:NADH-quinone oxidoreductase subunit N
VAQVGYILLGFLGAREMAAGSLVYYMAVYLVGNMAAFFVFSIVGRDRPESLDSLRGLSRQSPALAAVLMLSMFSLAGVPPLAGFTGKFILFAAAAQGGHYLLLLVATLNSVASLYYYMIVVKEAYITEPEGMLSPLEIRSGPRWVLIALAIALLTLGLCPALNTAIFRIGAGL